MRIAALGEDSAAEAALEIESVQRIMGDAGHDCVAFDSDRALLRRLGQEDFDLVVLHWTATDFQRLGVVRSIRAERSNWVPILLVVDRNEEKAWVAALAAGADDLMVRPVRATELQARVHALLRRSCGKQDTPELRLGPFRFLTAMRELRVHDKPVDLNQREYALALFLFQNLGLLVSRDQLADAVWGADVAPGSRSIDTHMSRLRKKLNLRPSHGFLLSAAYGQGYRLEVIQSSSPESLHPVASIVD